MIIAFTCDYAKGGITQSVGTMELERETIIHYCLFFMDSAVEMYLYHSFINRQSMISEYFVGFTHGKFQDFQEMYSQWW